MPELPEVETIRRSLESKIINHTITHVQILTPKSFLGSPRQIINQKITRLTRLGKQLSIHLSNGLILLIHLKMTGQLIFDGQPTQSTRIIFHLAPLSSKPARRGGGGIKGGILSFNDQRKFGWIKIFTPQQLKQSQSTLGLDILDSGFSLKYFSSQLNSRKPIKLTLLDQSRFAGIGNIYAAEALFSAKIHPSTSANQLSLPQIKKLYLSIISTIKQAITHKGSTARDDHYRLPDNSQGSQQHYFRVYQRLGEPCPVCRTPISRLTLGGRGTFFCSKCQKL